MASNPPLSVTGAKIEIEGINEFVQDVERAVKQANVKISELGATPTQLETTRRSALNRIARTVAEFSKQSGQSISQSISLLRTLGVVVDDDATKVENLARTFANVQRQALIQPPTVTPPGDEGRGFDLGQAAFQLNQVAGALSAIGAGVKKAFDFATEGAQLERLRASFEALGNSEEDLERLRKASLGTITDRNLLLSVNRAQLLGVATESEKLAGLLQAAAVRGRALGLTTSQAFDQIITGIGRLSPLILDNLGIIVDAEATYSEFAATMGRVGSDLTEAEKRIALTNRVIAEGASLGPIVEDSAAKLEQFETKITNLVDGVKVFGATIAVDMLDRLDDLGNILRGQETEGQRVVRLFEEMSKGGLEGAQAFLELEQAGVLTRVMLEDGSIAVDGLVESLAALEQIMGTLTREGFLVEQMDLLERRAAAGDEEARRRLREMQEAQAAPPAEAQEEFFEDVTEERQNLSDKLADIEERRMERVQDSEEKRLADIANAHDRFAEKIVNIEEEAARRIEDAHLKAARNREDAQRDLSQDIADSLRDLESELAEIDVKLAEERLRDAERATARREQLERDHVKNLRDIQQQFAFDVQDAVSERDARAVLDLMRQRDFDIRNENESFQDRVTNEEANAATREAERERQAQRDRERLIEDQRRQVEELKRAQAEKLAAIEQALADELEKIAVTEERKKEDALDARNEELEKVEEASEDRLEAIEKGFEKQQRAAQKAFEKRLRTLVRAFVRENELTAQSMQIMFDIINSFIGEGGVTTLLFRQFEEELANLANATTAFQNNLPVSLGGDAPTPGAGSVGVPTGGQPFSAQTFVAPPTQTPDFAGEAAFAEMPQVVVPTAESEINISITSEGDVAEEIADDVVERIAEVIERSVQT
jgi:hypothetical protein